MPIISNTATEQIIANNILNTPLISSSSFTIFLSAIGSTIPEVKAYIILNVASFIIGIIHIPINIITPTIPTAFFKIIPHPNTASTLSPNIFPYYWY